MGVQTKGVFGYKGILSAKNLYEVALILALDKLIVVDTVTTESFPGVITAVTPQGLVGDFLTGCAFRVKTLASISIVNSGIRLLCIAAD